MENNDIMKLGEVMQYLDIGKAAETEENLTLATELVDAFQKSVNMPQLGHLLGFGQHEVYLVVDVYGLVLLLLLPDGLLLRDGRVADKELREIQGVVVLVVAEGVLGGIAESVASQSAALGYQLGAQGRKQLLLDFLERQIARLVAGCRRERHAVHTGAYCH